VSRLLSRLVTAVSVLALVALVTLWARSDRAVDWFHFRLGDRWVSLRSGGHRANGQWLPGARPGVSIHLSETAVGGEPFTRRYAVLALVEPQQR